MIQPKLKVISKKKFKKISGLSSGGYADTKRNIVYYTKDTTPFVIEHEKAHIELKHKPSSLNVYQFTRRELKADKLAKQRTNMKHYPEHYLKDIVNDASQRFEIPQKVAKAIVNKEARKLGLI